MVRHDELKIENVPITSLKPYDGNAKKHTNEQMDAIEASIKEFGFRNPIIVWTNEDGQPEIVAGHARAKAAQNLGMDIVPVIYVDDLSDAQRRALTLVDNQTTMMTEWDDVQLSYELDVLSEMFDMSDFGFEDVDVESDIEKDAKSEKEFESMELKTFEHHDYVVFVFDNQMDWLNIVSRFGLHRVDAGFYPAKKIGLGRVIDGKKLLAELGYKGDSDTEGTQLDDSR